MWTFTAIDADSKLCISWMVGTRDASSDDRPHDRPREGQNLSIRMANRRFTWLTSAFSKKLDQHCASLALCFFYFNFVCPHLILGTERNNRFTPAMAAGLEKKP